ncbi:MAG: STAS domain-containing protein [Chitinispirillales bacterium]|jgi:anti-anti-sigma regulatory factor|nr:STAS domain-containing protein [Chitinispirillales bacterium]
MDDKVKGNVLVCTDDVGVCKIKLVGSVRYDSSMKGFMDFVKAEIIDKDIEDVIIDMRDCEYIDSSDIGVLAQIGLTQQEKGAKKPIIIYSGPKEASSVLQAITDVNVNSLFEIFVDAEVGNDNYNELKNSYCNQHEFSKLMYKNHKLLSDLNESNRKRFESVLKYLGESASLSDRKTKHIPKITK